MFVGIFKRLICWVNYSVISSKKAPSWNSSISSWICLDLFIQFLIAAQNQDEILLSLIWLGLICSRKTYRGLLKLRSMRTVQGFVFFVIYLSAATVLVAFTQSVSTLCRRKNQNQNPALRREAKWSLTLNGGGEVCRVEAVNYCAEQRLRIPPAKHRLSWSAPSFASQYTPVIPVPCVHLQS